MAKQKSIIKRKRRSSRVKRRLSKSRSSRVKRRSSKSRLSKRRSSRVKRRSSRVKRRSSRVKRRSSKSRSSKSRSSRVTRRLSKSRSSKSRSSRVTRRSLVKQAKIVPVYPEQSSTSADVAKFLSIFPEVRKYDKSNSMIFKNKVFDLIAKKKLNLYMKHYKVTPDILMYDVKFYNALRAS